MTTSGMSILDRTLAQLRAEFGEPICRGDCCWWTLSREGRKPVRLSVFVDGARTDAEGWICDLQQPSDIKQFVIRSEAQIQPLISRVRQLMGAPTEAEAPPTSRDALSAPPTPRV